MSRHLAGFTDSERQALEYGFSSPHGAWAAPVRKMGGAFKRVIVRLQARELLTESTPYKVTRAGLAALVTIREQRDADSGCMAYQLAAQEAREALAAWPKPDPAPFVSFIVKRGEIINGALYWSVDDILEPKPRFTAKVFNAAVKRAKRDAATAAASGAEVRFFIELRRGRACGPFVRQIDPLREPKTDWLERAARARGLAAHYGALEAATGSYAGVTAACKSAARFDVAQARKGRLTGIAQ